MFVIPWPAGVDALKKFSYSDIQIYGILFMFKETTKIGKRGTLVIPLFLREHFGLRDGTLVITEERAEGVLIRPAFPLPMETYTQERKAEFLLSNAVDKADYEHATKEVERMGLVPAKIPHYKKKAWK